MSTGAIFLKREETIRVHRTKGVLYIWKLFFLYSFSMNLKLWILESINLRKENFCFKYYFFYFPYLHSPIRKVKSDLNLLKVKFRAPNTATPSAFQHISLKHKFIVSVLFRNNWHMFIPTMELNVRDKVNKMFLFCSISSFHIIVSWSFSPCAFWLT